MGKTPKIHFSEHRDGPLWETVCGRFEVTATDRIELVTCKKCIKRLHLTPVDITGEVAVAFQEIEPLRDPETGLPVLTRDTYSRRDCRCGHCDVCRHFAHIQIDHEVAPWKDSPHLHRQKRYRWPTIVHALQWYADTVADGYPEPSMGESLMRLGRQGTVIQGGDTLESRAMSVAEDRATIEKALNKANTETGAAKAMFLAMIGRRHMLLKQTAWIPVPLEEIAEAMDVSSQAVKNLVKRTRMRFRLAMIELEAIPPLKVVA